jgi:hypothetical protein
MVGYWYCANNELSVNCVLDYYTRISYLILLSYLGQVKGKFLDNLSIKLNSVRPNLRFLFKFVLILGLSHAVFFGQLYRKDGFFLAHSVRPMSVSAELVYTTDY